ncbi:hypothetical protein Tco_1297800 [Tanacetum coccineum]
MGCYFVIHSNRYKFLEKPEESNGFEGIIDFLNASSNKYALTVNPTVYESCIKQFWETAKAKIVNGEHQIQALPGMNLVALWHLLSSVMLQKFYFSKYIFDNMMKNFEGGVKFLMYPRFVQVFLDNKVEGMTKHKGIYVTPSHTKKVFANMKREGKGFSGKVTPLFQTMMVQAPEDMGEDSAALTDSHSTPIITQPSSSKPQKKNLQEKVLDLEKAKTTQAKDIASKGVVAKKEVAKKQVSASDPVTTAGEVVTTANVKVTTASAPTTTIYELTLAQTLIEIKAAKPKDVTSADTITTTTRPNARGVVVQEPSEFKTTSSPSQASQLPQAKEKGKAKMVEPKKPSKKKDPIGLDEELALRLHAEEQAKLERMQKERVAQEEASRAAIIEELDSIQAMIEADEQLASRL